MALPRQKVQLSIVDGLDTKTDDKNVLATNFLELENAVFTKTGSLTKRNGGEVLSKKTISGETLGMGFGLATFEEELLHFDGTSLHSYLDNLNLWVKKGSTVSTIANTKSILKNSFQQTNSDYGNNSGTEAFVWEDSRGGVRYSVLDSQSGSFLVSDQLLSATGKDPKVFSLSDSLVLVYSDGVRIVYRRIQLSSPALLGPEQDLVVNLSLTGLYDIVVCSDRLFVVWENSLNGISARYLTKTFLLSSEESVPSETPVTCLAVNSDCNNDIQVVYYNGAEVKFLSYAYDLSSLNVSPTVIDTIANISHVAVKETDTNTRTFTVLYESDKPTDNNFITKNTIDINASVGTPSVFVRSVGLASKIFTFNNNFYVVAVSNSPLQSTYHAYSLSGDLIANISGNTAGGYIVGPNLPEVIEESEGVFSFSTLKKHSLQSNNGTLFSLTGVQKSTIDFTSNDKYLNAQLADNLHIVGGILQMYDGNSIVEHGFLKFPEGVTDTISTGGSLTSGQYSYSVVYAWTDNRGQIHRSAPSIPQLITVVDNDKVTLTIPTLRITKKDNVFIEVYRTESNGTISYKVTDISTPLFNDKSVDTVTFTDGQADSTIIDNEVLYTTGGVVDNIAPPSSSLITTYKSRIILGGLEDPNTLVYSKERFEGFPVEFNDGYSITIDAKGGKMTALANLDDYVIIFKKRGIFAFSGEGPNNLGQQNDFRQPQMVTSDAGCVDSNSVVEVPEGLMFKSEKGIYLLNRGLQVQYIGGPVEKYNSETISSAVLITNTNQVRFTTENNVALIYDYFHRRWTTFTNYEAIDSDIHKNSYVLLKQDGRVFREVENKFTDDAQRIKMKIVTSWIQLAGIQGFQRFYKLLLLGNYKGNHTLKVKLGYDFNPAFTEEADIDASILDTANYGDTSNYGDDSVYGGQFPLYEWRVFPQTQKCESFRISIEDFQFDNFGESYSISNLAAEIGIKSGLYKKKASNSVGTSTGGQDC